MRRFLYRARRGTSLVEILVAMVILLIGIYSLVRLFPAGFTMILYGKNVSQAQTLTRGMVEAAKLRYDQLPNGILAMDPIRQSAYPELPVDQELMGFQPDPKGAPDTRFSDVNKVRRVLGEGTKIPAPTITSPYMPVDRATGQRLPVSVYVLSFSPIYSVVPTKYGLGGIFVYSGNSLNRVVFDGPPDDAELAALDINSYGIDYGNATLYFRPAPYERRFKLEYSFSASAGNGFVREQSRPDTCVLIAANQRDYDMRQAHSNQPPDCVFVPLPSGARLEREEEFAYRQFRLVRAAEPFSNEDPYEFKVLNSVIGIVGFNPLAATFRPRGTDSRGITARIDYDVDDWHIIHEDREVPSSAPHQVKLTLDGIERIGALDEYQERYNGLIKNYPDRPAVGTLDVDLLVVDLDTGLTIDSRTLQRSGENPELKQPYINENGEINYNDGSITFAENVRWTLPTASGAFSPPDPVAGKRVRIYYRTRQNWALQMTKAFTNYVREPDAQGLGYREFYLHVPQSRNPDQSGYLFFPVADHGQAVLVDYSWWQRVGNQSVLRTETGEYHQIHDPADPDSPQNSFGFPFPSFWWTRVDAAGRANLQFDANHPILIQRVRGISVRARAIWREGNRWRRLDLDSYVGRDRGT